MGVGGADVFADQGLDLVHRGGLIFGLEVPGFLGGVFRQLDDRVDHGLDALVRKGDGAQNFFFRQFLDFRFHHHHRVLRAGHDEVEARGRQDVDGGVQHIFAVDEADAGRADRAHEGQARQGQRRRSGDHGHDVRIIFQVVGQDGDDDLRLVLEALDEQGANRTVDQARDQSLFFRRTAFTLEEAAGDLACGEGLFLIIDGQGEEIEARLGGLGGDDGRQHGGFAVGGEDRGVGLTSDAARFQRQLAAAPFEALALDIKHVGFVFPFTTPRGEFRRADRGGRVRVRYPLQMAIRAPWPRSLGRRL